MPEAIAPSNAPHIELSIPLDPFTARLWRENVPREHRQQAARAAILAFCEVDPDERKIWTDERHEVLFHFGGAGYEFFAPIKQLYVTISPWLEAKRKQVKLIGKRPHIIGGDWVTPIFQVAVYAKHCLDDLLAGYQDEEINHGLADLAERRAAS